MSGASDKPTVVVIGPVGAVGGMATSMRLQLNGSLAREYRLIPFDNSKRTPPDRTLWQGITAQLGLVYALLSMLRKYRPDIVHIHTCSGPTFYRSSLDLLLAKLHGLPVILHIRGGRFGEFLQGLTVAKRRLVRRALLSADRVIALSPSWERRIQRFDSQICLRVVPNGVVSPSRTKQWHPQSKVKIVFIGTTKRSKGVDALIEAVGTLPKATRSRLEVAIIGPDPEDRSCELRRHIEKLGLEHVIDLAGVLTPDEVRDELRRASIFTLPSHAEGLPNALLEAMAVGLPCVVSDVGAIPEVITDGVDGFLVKAGNVEHLSACLKNLIGSLELRKRVGRAARKRVRGHFCQEKVAGRLGEVYRELLTPHGDRS